MGDSNSFYYKNVHIVFYHHIIAVIPIIVILFYNILCHYDNIDNFYKDVESATVVFSVLIV